MSLQEWPAEDYAIGSYIQATIADDYLNYLTINPSDRVLDIGCGNGSFSRKILEKIPQGSFLGIDASKNMINLAKKKIAHYPNANVEQVDVLSMKFNEAFDYIVSFWCLQWCAFAIKTAFENIHHALKKGGKTLCLFPAGDDPFINSYHAIKNSGQFDCLDHFKTPVNYDCFSNLEEKINSILFKSVQVKRIKHSILLPSLDVFRKFVNGIAFFQGQVPEDQIRILNEAMIRSYALECQEKYQNQYWFHCSVYLVSAEK